jgi:hypothetical protein
MENLMPKAPEFSLKVDADRLVSSLQVWKSSERDRASDAGEMRQEIGQYLEDTGLNNKALSIARGLDKLSEDKRADTLRSLDHVLTILRPHWDGQSTVDMFDDAPDAGAVELHDGPVDGNIEPYDPDLDGNTLSGAA